MQCAPRPLRGLAQLVEQRIPNPQVVGSNPPAPAKPRHTANEAMATTEDVKKDDLGESDGESGALDHDAPPPSDSAPPDPQSRTRELALSESRSLDDADPHANADEALGSPVPPAQLGYRRFVYAAYFAGAIAVAFLVSKAASVAWARLAAWKPMIGEPHDEVVMPLAGLIGALTAIYYWRRTRARQLAEQVAEELSKVTWPDRKEVTNSTFVVIVTTIVSTIFFALMDRFWGFVTNLVYGT